MFKQYKRTQIAEMRPVSESEIDEYYYNNQISIIESTLKVSISDSDIKNGSPKKGDMIARNPKNHNDQWLVAEQYFKDNFEEIIPKDVEQAQKYISECHNDIGFMGSPEYDIQKKIVDDYFEPIRQKEKEDEEKANYLRLKSKYEGS